MNWRTTGFLETKLSRTEILSAVGARGAHQGGLRFGVRFSQILVH
jgi:hypothetical protein